MISIAASHAEQLFNSNITLTNGPDSPNGRVYLGATRTNVLLCQIELDSTVNVEPWGAWAQFEIEVKTRYPGADRSINNIRAYTSDGRLLGRIFNMGGWSLNDETVSVGFYYLYQDYALNAFAVTPGTPTIINIYADLGPGFKTLDTIKLTMNGSGIHNLIALGNYYSPIGQAVGNITVNSDEAYIDSLQKPSPSTVSIHGYGRPSAVYQVETKTSLSDQWQTASGSPVTSSASGEIQFDGMVDGNNQSQFFRFVLN